VFRDSRGVVHTVSSADPLEDLPADAARALQQALLTPGDLGSALERCDAVRDLVERWQDAFFAALPAEIDLAEEAEWAAKAGLTLEEFEAEYDDDEDEDDDPGLSLASLEPEELGLLVDDDDDAARALLPEELVGVLERELLLLPLRTRLEALVAAGDLVAGWSDLLADHEKLLGHLVLRHGGWTGWSDAEAPPAHEELADEHARRHELSGPAHPPLAGELT
jgi:hypothetical protein